jgi:hypothetical protein
MAGATLAAEDEKETNLHDVFTLPTVAQLVLPIPVLRYRF